MRGHHEPPRSRAKESEEIRKLKRQTSDLKEEKELLKNATVRMGPNTSAKKSSEVCAHPLSRRGASDSEDLRLAWCQSGRLLQAVKPWHP